MTVINWKKYWWQAGFATAFVAIGVPYWLIPYGRLNLPDALLGPGLVVLFAATVLTRFYSARSFLRVAVVLGSVVPAVVMSRVVADGVRDATSHNLWPLEIIIAVIVGGIVAMAGAATGGALLWLSRRERGNDKDE